MRDEGYYFVKYKGKWEVAKYLNYKGYWLFLGFEYPFEDSDFEEIGHKIGLPS